MSSPSQENTLFLVSCTQEASQTIKNTGFECKWFSSTNEMFSSPWHNAPSGVIFDLEGSHNENSVNVTELVAFVRENWPETPVMAISSGKDEFQIKRALNLGVSDFLISPFSSNEFSTRLKIKQEEAKARNAAEVIQFGDIEINSRQRTVSGPEKSKTASPIEINLLMSLARANGEIVDKDTIKTQCWGEMKVTDNALHRKLHALRQLLRDVSTKVTVETKYGAGISLGYNETQTDVTRNQTNFDQAS